MNIVDTRGASERVARESADKAARTARRIEQARACDSAESPVDRMARAWEGPSNSGTAKISPSGLSEGTAAARGPLAAVKRAFERHRQEGLPKSEKLSKEDRARAARSLREMAQRVDPDA